MTTLHNSGNSIDLEKLAPGLLVIIVNIIVIAIFIASINMIIIFVTTEIQGLDFCHLVAGSCRPS